MAVKALKAMQRNGRAAAKPNRTTVREKLDVEALMTEIENDPDAPMIAKDVVAYWRVRDKSGEPYLTIEQIQEELGRE